VSYRSTLKGLSAGYLQIWKPFKNCFISERRVREACKDHETGVVVLFAVGLGLVLFSEDSEAVPYWRLALFHQFGKHSFEIGTYGLAADVYSPNTDSGPTNSFTDYAFDAQFQYVSNPRLFSLHATWIHEDQDYQASYPQGATSNASYTPKTFKINAGYFYTTRYGIFGGYTGYFSTTGTSDPLLYPPDPVYGSATGSPYSNGFSLEADWVSKKNTNSLSSTRCIRNSTAVRQTMTDPVGTHATTTRSICSYGLCSEST
jgi:hypothetical protein